MRKVLSYIFFPCSWSCLPNIWMLLGLQWSTVSNLDNGGKAYFELPDRLCQAFRFSFFGLLGGSFHRIPESHPLIHLSPELPAPPGADYFHPKKVWCAEEGLLHSFDWFLTWDLNNIKTPTFKVIPRSQLTLRIRFRQLSPSWAFSAAGTRVPSHLRLPSPGLHASAWPFSSSWQKVLGSEFCWVSGILVLDLFPLSSPEDSFFFAFHEICPWPKVQTISPIPHSYDHCIIHSTVMVE